jgi:hypothetical protein
MLQCSEAQLLLVHFILPGDTKIFQIAPSPTPYQSFEWLCNYLISLCNSGNSRFMTLKVQLNIVFQMLAYRGDRRMATDPRKLKKAISLAGKKVALAENTQSKPRKKMVTLYLDEELYERLQKGKSRKVSLILNDLIRAYLDALDAG